VTTAAAFILWCIDKRWQTLCRSSCGIGITSAIFAD